MLYFNNRIKIFLSVQLQHLLLIDFHKYILFILYIYTYIIFKIQFRTRTLIESENEVKIRIFLTTKHWKNVYIFFIIMLLYIKAKE